MIDILHDTDDGPHLAFRYRQRPARGDALMSELAVNLDGTTPQPGDMVICGTCGADDRLTVGPIINELRPDGGYA